MTRTPAIQNLNEPLGPSRRHLTAAMAMQLAVRLVGVATGIVVAASLARGLSHDDFGRFSLALSLVAVATNIGDFGITNTAVRHLAVHPDAPDRTAGALVLARLVTGPLTGAAVCVIATVLDSTRDGRLSSVLVAASLLLGPLFALQPMAQVRLRFGPLNALLLLQSLGWTTAVLCLGVAGAALPYYGLAFLLAATVQGVASWLAFRRITPINFHGALPELRRILRIAWPVGLGGLFVTAYYRLDGVLLYYFKGPGATADYSAAYRFLDVLQIVPMTLLMVALPLLASTWRPEGDPSHHRRDRLLALTLSSTVAISLPLTVGGAILAPSLVHLVYGPTFVHTAPMLAVLLFAFPGIAIGYVAVCLALASGSTGVYAGVATGAAVVNLAANVVLMPRYGAMAAAWTTVATETFVASLLLVLMCRRTGVHVPVRPWSGAVIASAVMALPVAALREEPLIVPLLVGGVVYSCGALLLKAVTVQDIRALIDRRALDWMA